MERIAVSLCPSCMACPEVVIEGDTIRIGEDENIVVLQKAEWNVLVDAIQSAPLPPRPATYAATESDSTVVKLMPAASPRRHAIVPSAVIGFGSAPPSRRIWTLAPSVHSTGTP